MAKEKRARDTTTVADASGSKKNSIVAQKKLAATATTKVASKEPNAKKIKKAMPEPTFGRDKKSVRKEVEDEDEEMYDNDDDAQFDKDGFDGDSDNKDDNEDGNDNDEKVDEGEGEDDNEDDEEDAKAAKKKKKKADTVKPSKKEKKEAIREKKAKLKPNFDLILQSKFKWEDFRKKRQTPEKRHRLINEVLALVSGKIFEISHTPNGSRILQSCIKHGTEEQRETIIQELTGKIATICEDKYGHNLVKKLLKYGNKEQRSRLIPEFYGKVKKLITKKTASNVVEYLYSVIATPAQKYALIREFFGAEFTFFKTEEHKTLEQIFAENPEKKKFVIPALSSVVRKVTEKGLIDHMIVQRIVHEFFKFAEYKEIAPVVESLRDAVIHILHTKDGSAIGVYCLAYGTPKDRKHILKSFKGHVKQISEDEYGHLVLCRAFDSVDDTKQIKDYVLTEYLENLFELANHKHARRILLHILGKPEVQTKYFAPDMLKLFEPVKRLVDEEVTNPDGTKTTKQVMQNASKKDPAVRRNELIEVLAQPLLDMIKEKAQYLLSNPYGSAVLIEALNNITADRKDCYIAITNLLMKKHELLANKTFSRSVKQLIQSEQGKQDEVIFSSILAKSLKGSYFNFAINLGGWVIAALLKTLPKEQKQPILTELAASIDKIAETGAKEPQTGCTLLATVYKEQTTGQVAPPTNNATEEKNKTPKKEKNEKETNNNESSVAKTQKKADAAAEITSTVTAATAATPAKKDADTPAKATPAKATPAKATTTTPAKATPSKATTTPSKASTPKQTPSKRKHE